MRAHFVELFAEPIEASLLTAQGGGRWPSGFLLERSVHALVSTVLFGVTGLDEFGIDPEADPPDREAAQSSNGRRGEGHPLSERMILGSPYSSKRPRNTGLAPLCAVDRKPWQPMM